MNLDLVEDRVTVRGAARPPICAADRGEIAHEHATQVTFAARSGMLRP